MKKNRVRVPKAVTERVMKEYHHKCAMCGRPNPHLHHIDENPSNNDASNLLPLCPNHHLQDTHSPTTPLDPGKLRLFRRCKDPFILDPRFHPIWTRLRFLREGHRGPRTEDWNTCWIDLTRFIEAFEKGHYYSARLLNQMHAMQDTIAAVADVILGLQDEFATTVEDLCVEMLRYQGWQRPKEDAE